MEASMKGNKTLGQMIRLLFQYSFPAIGGLLVAYLYNTVDGIFIGRGVGSLGLGAVDVAVPFITTGIAGAALFPMGGATVVAIRLGRGDKEGANDAFNGALLLSVIYAFVIMLLGMAFPRQICMLVGAEDLSAELLGMASDYLFWYTAFSFPFLIGGICLPFFVRNDGASGLAFFGTLAGAAANVFLDWLMIFPLRMGLKGAALASGLGQVVTFVILISHFIRKKGDLYIKFSLKIPRGLFTKLLKRGAPETISELITPVNALCYNIVLAKAMGDLGVSTYVIESFIFSLVYSVLSGVSQGIQPLWGQAYGRGDKKEIKAYLRLGMVVNFTISVIILALLYLFGRNIVKIFTTDPVLLDSASSPLFVFSLAYLPMSINLIYTAFFFSTKRSVQANIIAMTRGVVLKAICILAIPAILGNNAVWYAAAICEILTLVMAVFMAEGPLKSESMD